MVSKKPWKKESEPFSNRCTLELVEKEESLLKKGLKNPYLLMKNRTPLDVASANDTSVIPQIPPTESFVNPHYVYSWSDCSPPWSNARAPPMLPLTSTDAQFLPNVWQPSLQPPLTPSIPLGQWQPPI